VNSTAEDAPIASGGIRTVDSYLYLHLYVRYLIWAHTPLGGDSSSESYSRQPLLAPPRYHLKSYDSRPWLHDSPANTVLPELKPRAIHSRTGVTSQHLDYPGPSQNKLQVSATRSSSISPGFKPTTVPPRILHSATQAPLPALTGLSTAPRNPRDQALLSTFDIYF